MLEMVQTVLVYLITGFICYLLAKKAAKKNKKKYVVFMVLILSAVAGLRAYTVGIDTQNYVEIFKNIANGDFIHAYGVEESFKYICSVFLFICKSPTWMFIVFACVTNGFILARLWECREFAEFKYSFLCYYSVFFFMTMNICRQFAAIAIVFWATRYISSRKYFKFIVIVLCVSLIHTSSLLGMLFLVFEIFNWKYLNKNQKLWMILGILMSPAAVVVFFIGWNRYSHLISNISGSIGIMLILKMIVYVFSLLIIKKELSESDDAQLIKTLEYKSRSVSIYYLCGILLTSLGYFIPYADRIGLMFYMFECVHIGKTIKLSRNRSLKVCFICLEIAILLFYFITSIAEGSQGISPYKFVWQA